MQHCSVVPCWKGQRGPQGKHNTLTFTLSLTFALCTVPREGYEDHVQSILGSALCAAGRHFSDPLNPWLIFYTFCNEILCNFILKTSFWNYYLKIFVLAVFHRVVSVSLYLPLKASLKGSFYKLFMMSPHSAPQGYRRWLFPSIQSAVVTSEFKSFTYEQFVLPHQTTTWCVCCTEIIADGVFQLSPKVSLPVLILIDLYS